MKKTFLIPTLLVAFGLFSCNEKAYIDSPGDNSHNQDSLPVTADPDPTPDPQGVDIPEGTINVFEAVKIAKKLKSGEVTEQSYYIKGWVTGFNRGASFADDFPKYGNDFVYISAVNDGTSNKTFYAYRLLGKGGAKLPDLECILEGDFIVINCKITNYNGVYESSGSCTTARSNNAHFNEVYPPFPGCPEPGPGEISVNRAIEISDSIGSGNTTTEKYKIRGVVTSVNASDFNPQYGNITFNISSEGDHSATCYRMTGRGGKKFTNVDQVAVGDTVLVIAKIQNYNGTCEPTQGSVEESTNANYNEAFPPEKPFPGCPEPGPGEISVNRAIEISDSIGSGKTTTESYKIRCVVTTVTDMNTQYGNATFNASSDGVNFATCYRINYKKSGGKFTDANQLLVGDTILVNAKIQNYNGTCEPVQGFVEESTNPNF